MISSVAFPTLLYFSTLTHKQHDFEKKVVEHEIVYFMFMVPCIILYSMNNQQKQLYAVNFIPLLGSLYMYQATLGVSS